MVPSALPDDDAHVLKTRTRLSPVRLLRKGSFRHMFKIIVKYDDGHELPETRDYGDLRDAAAHALRLADRLWLSRSDSVQKPTHVRIHRGDRLELAISLDGWGPSER
jgi:hypothetical protein